MDERRGSFYGNTHGSTREVIRSLAISPSRATLTIAAHGLSAS